MHLSDYMAKHKLDDAAMAEKIGRTRATVSRIRRRVVRPDWETISRLSSLTKGQVTADDFQKLEDAQ